MLIYNDPDKYVPVVERTVCGYHTKNPGKPFAGCTCTTALHAREATPEEYRARRHKRLSERRDELQNELARIDAELAT